MHKILKKLPGFRLLKEIFLSIKSFFPKLFNKLSRKNKEAILFIPHTNCKLDDYDILNGQSSNVLCLFNSILKDKQFKDFSLYIVYYNKEKLSLYQNYCQDFNLARVHFIFFEDSWSLLKAVAQCYTIFTDSDWTRIYYRIASQRLICLNYFGGLIKNEFYRWECNGGFKEYLAEQKRMFRLYDYHLSISDICSKFIALDNCHYYPHFVSLGFPRNDIFFEDNSYLRQAIQKIVDFPIKKIITYVPTHRDYENPERDFYDKKKSINRSIWGYVGTEELSNLENTLVETGTLIIAKVHPIQKETGTIDSNKTTKHIIFYSDLVKQVKTSLNPLLAISDSIITDYTTTVYDFLYLNRPIIYYFYDLQQYRATRGFFIEPIESVCAGHITKNLNELQSAIKDIYAGLDPWAQKRKFLQEIFIKDLDGDSCKRIKKYFFQDIIK